LYDDLRLKITVILLNAAVVVRQDTQDRQLNRIKRRIYLLRDRDPLRVSGKRGNNIGRRKQLVHVLSCVGIAKASFHLELWRDPPAQVCEARPGISVLIEAQIACEGWNRDPQRRQIELDQREGTHLVVLIIASQRVIEIARRALET